MFIVLPFAIPLLVLSADFAQYFFSGKRLLNKLWQNVFNIIVVLGFPLFYLGIVDERKNDCCSDSASFSPEHVITIYLFVALCVVAFFYSSWRKTIAPPLIEITVNSFLLIGILLNTAMLFHLIPVASFIGNVPVILVFIFQLIDNQKKLLDYLATNEIQEGNLLNKLLWGILKLKPVYKMPLLFVLCLPLFTIVTGLLLLLGQKPDSMIRAFTDTYKHGLSQWDDQCIDVSCGGHYLCSVAAKGHPTLVRPQRFGIRNEQPILCNRQLLVSNAFEELLQERLPIAHSFIRRRYNKVGGFIHRYYFIFNIKLVSDFIYILMKPLEWFFLFVLYTFDTKPENRIAKQYLSLEDREKIKKKTLL